jgi:hypothetical protein
MSDVHYYVIFSLPPLFLLHLGPSLYMRRIMPIQNYPNEKGRSSHQTDISILSCTHHKTCTQILYTCMACVFYRLNVCKHTDTQLGLREYGLGLGTPADIQGLFQTAAVKARPKWISYLKHAQDILVLSDKTYCFLLPKCSPQGTAQKRPSTGGLQLAPGTFLLPGTSTTTTSHADLLQEEQASKRQRTYLPSSTTQPVTGGLDGLLGSGHPSHFWKGSLLIV